MRKNTRSGISQKNSYGNPFATGFSELFYRLFWKECGCKNNLTLDEKVSLVREVSDFSLRQPYWQLSAEDKVHGKTLAQLFPKLVPANLCPEKQHTHLTDLSGLLLYVIHTELFSEVKALAENGQISQEQCSTLSRVGTS